MTLKDIIDYFKDKYQVEITSIIVENNLVWETYSEKQEYQICMFN